MSLAPPPSARVEASGRGSERLVFLDGLRAVASVGVVVYHAVCLSGLEPLLGRAFSAPVIWVCRQGWNGVWLFFVLSGYVIAQSVGDALVTPRFLAQFAVRRSVRLDLPFWFTLGVASALRWAVFVLLHDPTPPPSAATIAAHFFYAQNILGLRLIVSQFWTLSYEIQFYLCLVLLVGLSQRVTREATGWTRRPGSLLVLLPMAAISLGMLATKASAGGWLFDFWYMFFLGAITCWAVQRRIAAGFWYAAVLAVCAAGVAGHDWRAAAAVISAAVIYAAGRLGTLTSWLGARPIQYFGRISYSLYLAHFVGSMVARVGARYAATPLGAVGWLVAANVASVGAAHVLHRFVEAPSMRLAKGGRVFAWLERRLAPGRALGLGGLPPS